jgi:Protein kinase domain
MTAPSRATIPSGTQLNGVYEIDEPLAAGGMGEIYRAHAIQTGDAVAIKLIRADLAEDESVLALFRREAAALHRIYHEAIVRYYVFSVDPALRRPYLAMEFVVGEPLSDVLRAGPLSLAELMALKQRIGSGLDAAHRAGIVHRDVAPDNILVCDRDFSNARIIDFGIARSTKAGDHTVIGSGFAGKYNYVSPEQLGLFGGEVTGRSDIYSFGLVLAYAACGQRLDMGGSQFEVIEKRRSIPDLSGVYPEIRPLLTRMLQPDPAMRPASMREVADWTPSAEEPEERTQIRPRKDKKSAPGAGEADKAVPPPSPGAGGKFGALATAVAAIVVLAGLGGWAWLRFGGKPGEATPPPPAAKSGPSEAGLNPVAKEAAKPAAGSAVKPAAEPAVDLAQRVRDFMRHYDTGGCAMASSFDISGAVAQIKGFGLDAKPFEKLDTAFRQKIGVEPDITVHAVTLDFLSRIGVGGPTAPKLSLRAASIHSGDVLSGKVSGDSANLDLLIIDDDGKVYRVTEHIHSDNVFSMVLKKTGGARAHPMLLVALASPTPLASVRSAHGAAGDAFFRVLTDETAGLSGVTASVLYFEIE